MWWSSKPSMIEDGDGDLAGKTIILTGATRGIGFELAKMLANRNPGRLILTCRDEKSGKEILQRIITETGCKTAQMWTLDLDSFESVRAFVRKLNASGDEQCHLLILNAAISTGIFKETMDGYEQNLQVNHLASALLVLLLLPNMERTQPTRRIVFVGSYGYKTVNQVPEAHLEDDVTMMDVLSDSKKCAGDYLFKFGIRYCLTKLFLLQFAKRLHDHVFSSHVHSPITTTTVCPGLCSTSITTQLRKDHLIYRLFWAYSQLTRGQSPEEGANRILHAAIGMKDEECAGKFLENYKESTMNDFMKSSEGQYVEKKCWDETLQIAVKVAPEVKEVVKRLMTEPVPHQAE